MEVYIGLCWRCECLIYYSLFKPGWHIFGLFPSGLLMELRPEAPFDVLLHLDKGKSVPITNEPSGRPRLNVLKHQSSLF